MPRKGEARHSRSPVCPAAWDRRTEAYDRGRLTEAPCAAQVARTVVQQRWGSDPSIDCNRLNAPFRERLAPLACRSRALARRTLTLHEGLWVVGTVDNFCTPHASLSHTQQTTPAMVAGSTDHCWTMHELWAFHVPCLAGHHRSGVDVLHGHCNTCSRAGVRDHG
jgi:hypothetical protein